MEFVKVPRKLIEDTSIGDKRVLVYSSIAFTYWSGQDEDKIISACGYSPCDRHSESAGSKAIECVQQLRSNSYIEQSRGRVSLCADSGCFGMIYADEYKQIVDARRILKGKRINHAHILLFLAHVRCFMSKANNYPRFYSNLLMRIADNIGISVRSVSTCARILEDLEILHSEELPRYKDGYGRWHTNVRIFVDIHSHAALPHSSYCWQRETQRGIMSILSNQMG